MLSQACSCMAALEVIIAARPAGSASRCNPAQCNPNQEGERMPLALEIFVVVAKWVVFVAVAHSLYLTLLKS
jgi:hypothetical protein